MPRKENGLEEGRHRSEACANARTPLTWTRKYGAEASFQDTPLVRQACGGTATPSRLEGNLGVLGC